MTAGAADEQVFRLPDLGEGLTDAEIAARVQERCFHSLAAPVLRVAGFDIPYPPATIEEHYVPSADRIARAVRRTVEY